MSPKLTKTLFWIATVLFSAMMLLSASMYIFKHEMVRGFFEGFGYPTYLIYPLALAKILGVLAITTRYNSTLKEWAYAAFFFEILLAFFAHFMIGDGGEMSAIIAMALLMTSYFLQRQFK